MPNVTEAASEELLSTVTVLTDQVLLERTKMLARHEQALQLCVLDHLREIEARRLYLRLGYSSLFDYAVRELRYTEAAAWRRIKAMRLCRETRGVREWLQDGSLNLSNAALLQNCFERWDRNGGGPTAAGSPGAEANVAPRAGSAPSAPAGEAEGSPSPVLDAHARQRLVEQAVGKSTRQVQQMLADVDPEAVAPAERLRALGDGRWELKTVIDAECQRGLQQLRELLSHVDPHLTVGQLVGRLVREGLDRYDPSRPPRRKRKSDSAGVEGSSGTAAPETAERVVAVAANPRRSGRSAKQTAHGTAADLPGDSGSRAASPKRGLGRALGSRTSAPKRVARCADRGSNAGAAAATEPTSAPKPRMTAGRCAGSAKRTSTRKPRVASGRSIPAAVKREVWRRDQGCCTYVDRHTGRRCGSRFFLELDHIVPVAVGGGAEPGNLALRCAAHHRYRHSRPGQRSAARDSVT